jgi:Zn-dependent protease
MTGPVHRSRFSETYRQQYRQISGSKTSKVFRWITPLVLIAAAILGRTLSHGHSVLSVVLGVAAVVLIVVALVLGRRERTRR